MDSKVLSLNDLPVEVLDHIFSFLPLSDRKSVSLVCRTWEEVAFGQRGIRKVALEIRVWCDWQLTFLRRTSRRYRNVFVHLDPVIRNDSEFRFIVKVLDLLGAHLESFQCLGFLRMEQLLGVVTRLPKLQQLVVGLEASTLNQRCLDFPALTNLRELGSLINVLQISNLNVPKLSHLSIILNSSEEGRESISILRQLAPQLKSVELFSMGYFIPIDELQFPSAEVLKIGGKFCESENILALRTFFAGFKVLKEVKLDFAVTELVLDMITKACPGIENLHLKVSRLNPESFRWMERLRYLKVLSLGDINDTLCEMSCKSLVSVKQLHLEMSGCSVSFFKELRQLVPNVTSLAVTLINNFSFEWWLEVLCQNFPHLRQLTISDEVNEDRMLGSSFLCLDQLNLLEELTFKNIQTRVVCMPPIPQLRRLTIDEPYWLTNNDLLELVTRYPNLKYLELGSGTQVTDASIREIRSQLKDCLVHCVPSSIIWSNVITVYRDILEIPLHMM